MWSSLLQPQTVRAFTLGTIRGWAWGFCWRGEGAGCQGSFDLPEVGLRFPTVVP